MVAGLLFKSSAGQRFHGDDLVGCHAVEERKVALSLMPFIFCLEDKERRKRAQRPIGSLSAEDFLTLHQLLNISL